MIKVEEDYERDFVGGNKINDEANDERFVML